MTINLSLPNIYSIGDIFNTIVMKNFVLKLFHSFNYTATLDHTVMLSNLYHFRIYSTFYSLNQLFHTPNYRFVYFEKRFYLWHWPLLPLVNIQSVRPFRGGGDHDVEPFVLMATI